MIMLSIATAVAVSKEIKYVHTAVHAGDHDIYPDCRPEFINAITRVTQISNYQPVSILDPYRFLSKGDILTAAQAFGLGPANYINTWTCYKGGSSPCGRCGACVERLEAFDSVGWEDPWTYQDREFWKEAVDGN
jgi:7-cyano-7-deazaguanine synthase